MSDKTILKVDWATHRSARYACEKWHYSGCLPAGKLVKVGVWEKGKFIGAIIFGRGANNNMAQKYGLKQTEACELVRVALREHESLVSRIIKIALMFIKKQSKGLRLVVSYADPKQNHHGGIYQASNFLYLGKSQPQREILIEGRFMHKRSASALYGTASPDKISEKTGKEVKYAPIEWKHIYVFPLDKKLKSTLMSKSQDYPKRQKKHDSEHPSESGRGSTDPGAPILSKEASSR